MFLLSNVSGYHHIIGVDVSFQVFQVVDIYNFLGELGTDNILHKSDYELEPPRRMNNDHLFDILLVTRKSVKDGYLQWGLLSAQGFVGVNHPTKGRTIFHRTRKHNHNILFSHNSIQALQ